MDGQRNPNITSAEEGLSQQPLDKGQGILSAMGQKLGQIPGLRNAIKAGALLGILGGSTSLEGCIPEDQRSEAVGSEKAGQGYSVVESALTAEEWKSFSIPAQVAGTKVGDSNPEFANIDGKFVMFIVRDGANGGQCVHYKVASTLKDLVDQGEFIPLQGAKGSSGIGVYGNKGYINMGGPMMESDISFNGKGELETANVTDTGFSSGSDFRVTTEGILYKTNAGGSLYSIDLNQQQKTVVEIPTQGSMADIPTKVGDEYVGGKTVNGVTSLYSASTMEAVSGKNSVKNFRFNQGIQASKGNAASIEDGGIKLAAFDTWSSPGATIIKYSISEKPVVNPEPTPDAGGEVDAGSTETTPDTVQPGTDVVADTTDTQDTQPDVAPAEIAKDTQPDSTPAPDTAETSPDTVQPGTDVVAEVVDTQDTKPDVTPAEIAQETAPDSSTQPETAPDTSTPAPDAVAETSQPDSQAEITAADIVAEINSSDTHGETPGEDAAIIPQPDVYIQLDTSGQPHDAKTAEETNVENDTAQNTPKPDSSSRNPDSGNSSNDGGQASETSKKDSEGPYVGPKLPENPDALCSARPTPGAPRRGALALAALVAAAVMTILRRRKAEPQNQ